MGSWVPGPPPTPIRAGDGAGPSDYLSITVCSTAESGEAYERPVTSNQTSQRISHQCGIQGSFDGGNESALNGHCLGPQDTRSHWRAGTKSLLDSLLRSKEIQKAVQCDAAFALKDGQRDG